MKKPRGTSVQYVREDKKLCLVKWFDNKPINLLSTENGSATCCLNFIFMS